MVERETREHAHPHQGSILELSPGRGPLPGSGLLGPAVTVLGKVARRLSRQVVSYGVINVYVWDLQASVDLPSPEDFVARELEPDELGRVAAGFGRLPGVFHRRMHLGDRCFASFHGTKPIHLRWVARRPVRVTELGLML